jgi:single-strand DNA-binding protein
VNTTLNHVTLIGRITREPESQYTPGGHALTKFSIAVDRFTKNPETGEKLTDFFPVVCWKKTAEFVSQYLGKGRLICITGRIETRNWVSNDGKKNYMTEIIAEHVQGLDKPREPQSTDPRPATDVIPAVVGNDDDEADAFAED